MLVNQTEFANLAGVARQTVSKAIKAGKLKKRRDGKMDTNQPDNAAYLMDGASRALRQAAAEKNALPGKVREGRRKLVSIKEREKASLEKAKDAETRVLEAEKRILQADKKVKEAQRKEEEALLKAEVAKSRALQQTTTVATTPSVATTEHSVTDLDSLAETDMLQISAAEADRLKRIEAVLTSRQKRLKDRDELIPRKFVKTAFGKLYSILINEFLPMGDKIVPDLAGIFENTDPELITKGRERTDEEAWKVLRHIRAEFNEFLKTWGEEEELDSK